MKNLLANHLLVRVAIASLTLISVYGAPALAITPITDRDNVGLFTAVNGEVEVFSHPGREKQGPGPHVLYQDLYYSAAHAKVGSTVSKDNVIHTGPNGRGRVVFGNGDQLIVPPSSSVVVSWQADGRNANHFTVGMIYGKVRAVVSPSGPRSGLKVKTPSAVMGVRGTDLHVSFDPSGEQTKLTVLRGQVEMEPVKTEVKGPAPASTPSPSLVHAGQSGEIAAAANQTPQVRPAHRDELQQISQTTQVQAAKNLPQPVMKEVTSFEKQALVAVLKDVSKTDPALGQKLAKVTSPDQVNQMVVDRLALRAPAAPIKAKPNLKDLSTDTDVYKKYFKKVD